jgi:hypothetical protein
MVGAIGPMVGAIGPMVGAIGPMVPIGPMVMAGWGAMVSYLETTTLRLWTHENRTRAATTKRAKYIIFWRDILNFLFNIFIFYRDFFLRVFIL